MRLVIKKNQVDKRHFFKGHQGVNFTLEFWVELTEEEQSLVKRYKVDNEVLVKSKDGEEITIKELMKGISLTTQNIRPLLLNEELAISACKTFKNYLNVLRSFGGEYVLDIRDDGVFTLDGDRLE